MRALPTARVERTAAVLVVAATVWCALAVGWGLDGPIGGGHSSIVGSRGIMGENMLAWHIWGPVRQYTLLPPPPQLYYVHHPWGTYWVVGALTKLFGRHLFVPRLEPILMSIAIPPMLYGIGRVLWGPVPGALAAMGYVALPIVLAFGNFPGFEVPVNFSCVAVTWGYLHFQQKWSARWMAVTLAATLFCVNTDWEACIFLGAVLGGLLLAGYFMPRWFGPVPTRRFGQWWALSVTIAVVTVVAYAAYIKHIGMIDDFLAQETKREKGSDQPLARVLAARWYWIDLSFTPLAIYLGKAAVPVFFFRLFFLRRPLEIFPLAILLMATIEYVNFKNGADVHTFWPLPFAPYFALALGVLGQTSIGLSRLVLGRLRVAVNRDVVPLGALGCFGLVPVVMLPDAITGLVYAHTSGGRYNDNGHHIYQDTDKAQAAAWLGERIEGASSVLVHASMHSNWSVDWSLHRPTIDTDAIPTNTARADNRYFIGDLAFMKPNDQVTLMNDFHVDVIGQFAVVDRAAPKTPVDGYVFELHEPNALQWALVSGTDPMRTVRPDAWATWEFRETFGQTPNPPPEGEPTTIGRLRIAHNVAVAAGDAGKAAAYRKRLMNELDETMATTFTDGTELLGERFTRGVAPTLDVFFLAAGPAPEDDTQFDIRSVVRSAPRWSLVGADPKVKALGMPFIIPPKLWKAGFIYVDRNEIRHRPGREEFFGFFIGGSEVARPRPAAGGAEVPLLLLP